MKTLANYLLEFQDLIRLFFIIFVSKNKSFKDQNFACYIFIKLKRFKQKLSNVALLSPSAPYFNRSLISLQNCIYSFIFIILALLLFYHLLALEVCYQ